jgi:hypothetical protein
VDESASLSHQLILFKWIFLFPLKGSVALAGRLEKGFFSYLPVTSFRFGLFGEVYLKRQVLV